MPADYMGLGALVAAFSAAAWWWGRGVNARPDPGISKTALTAWRAAPAGVVVGLCVAVAAGFAQCGGGR